MSDHLSIHEQIEAVEKELASIEARKTILLDRLQALNAQVSRNTAESLSVYGNPLFRVTRGSSESEKISLFRNLFRGREDVFPKRFESKQSGKSGYQPVCGNEWIRPVCQKPKVKCGSCENQDFIPVTDDIVRKHLIGFDPNDNYRREFVIGVYPMLSDETCWFLVVDFDKETWLEDAEAYLEICRSLSVPAAFERSRSGNGGHIWLFFDEPVPAKLARQLGAFMLTRAMENRPEMGFDSYDRLFPSQDTLPKGGFGNLIALPFQKKPVERGNTLFLDDAFKPYHDQWSFLSSIQQLSQPQVQSIVDQAASRGGVLGVRFVSTDEDEISPWLYSPSGRKPEIPIKGNFPEQVDIVLGNQIFINKENLPSILKNRLIRLAAFQNPEFYKAQAMRFPTFDKPRIVHCAEDFPNHIGLPRGCLEDIMDLLTGLDINVEILDERFEGIPINVHFKGMLRPEQQSAADAMLEYDAGVLSASTAFGKTVVAAFLIAKRSVNTLVLVHRKQLLDQWIARLSTFLDISSDKIGQIGGGKRQPTGLIDVAMIQSLNRKGVINEIVGEYGHLVVDECHHISARSFEIVARQCKAKYVAGLSATVIRKDGHHPIIFMNCGPVRFRVDEKKQAEKRPFAHRVIVKNTSFHIPPTLDAGKYTAIHEIYTELVKDDVRNRMIVHDVQQVVSSGRFPVVLTERKEHLEILYRLLEGSISSIIVMKGGMGKKQRQAALSALENLPDGAEKIILATGRYLGEGFDEKRLDTLFLTLPISWRGILAQYAGRLHRIYDMKNEVIIYDYADLEVPMLSRMYDRRLKGYRSIGYEIIE